MIEIQSTMLMSRPPGVLMRDFRRAIKVGLQAALDYWWRQFLPRHFDRDASRRYKYRKRTPGHVKRKLRVHGHRRSLVYTGAMQRQLQRTRKITGTSKRAKLHMHARALNFMDRQRRRVREYPDMRAEILTVRPEEMKAMGTVINQTVVKELRKNPAAQAGIARARINRRGR